MNNAADPRTHDRVVMRDVQDALARRAIQLAAAEHSTPRSRAVWRRPSITGPAVAVLAAAALTVTLVRTDSGSSTPTPIPAEAVAASPADAASVVRKLGRQDLEPIATNDALIVKARDELRTDGVDPTQGVAVRLPGGPSGWLLGGNGTVCLVLPAQNAGTTTNCQEAGDALQHGFGRISYAGDPADASSSATEVLIVPPDTRAPYVTDAGSTQVKRVARLSSNGAVAEIDVRPGEALVNPAAPGGQQRQVVGQG